MPRIAGLVMARDEWPILGLAIAHALARHVDEVWVLDHASRDESAEMLARLAAHWPDRLHVLRSEIPEYHQEAATSVLLALAERSAPDWVYVFDADEFALTPHGSLHDVLTGVPEDCQAVRYAVHNWVAPVDLDDRDITQYRRVRHRSQPVEGLPRDGAVLAEGVIAGRLTFFDVPFDSKVIVRGGWSPWLHAGAHLVRWPERSATVEVSADQLCVAHLPLRSRAALEVRADQGDGFRRRGAPAQHGWQSQVVSRVRERGGLDEFWAAHSVGTPAGERPAPTVEQDDALEVALAEAEQVLLAALAAPAVPAVPAATDLAVDLSVGMAWALQEVGAQLREERNAARAESAHRAAELAGVRTELEGQRELAEQRARELQAVHGQLRDLQLLHAQVVGARRYRLASALARPIDWARGR